MNIFGYISHYINIISQTFGVKIHFEKMGNQYKWLQKYDIDTVIDIGANEGQFLSERLKIMPHANFHSFEPLPKVFKKLKIKFGNTEHVTLYNMGLGSSKSIMAINECDFSPSSSFLNMTKLHKDTYPQTQISHQTNVDLNTLDEIIDLTEKNALIKIDTQGYEMEVIKGGVHAMKNAKICIIECSFYPLYENQPLFGDIYQKMIELGYEYHGNIEQGIDHLNGNIIFCDAIYIKTSNNE